MTILPISPKRYDSQKIIENFNPLQVTQQNDRVITSYNGSELCNVQVSDRYQIFQVGDFVNRMLPVIEDYFTPSRYIMNLYGGVQELKLYGESFKVNGETYYELLSILNSTDKSKALQINIGLLRQVCTNGMVVSFEDNEVSIKAKHFKKSLPEKVDYFSSKLKDFKLMTQSQVEFINKLDKMDPVSFLEIADGLIVKKNKAGEVKHNPLGVKRTKEFGKMLIYSKSDKLAIDSYRGQRAVLDRPENYVGRKLAGTQKDVQLTAKTAFNCYIEPYKSSDSSILKSECDNILQFIN